MRKAGTGTIVLFILLAMIKGCRAYDTVRVQNMTPTVCVISSVTGRCIGE